MLTDGRTDGRTHGRTHGRTDDGRKVITIAHPEQSSGELITQSILSRFWFESKCSIESARLMSTVLFCPNSTNAYSDALITGPVHVTYITVRTV